MRKELQSHIDNKVYNLVKVSSNTPLVSHKWVYRHKQHETDPSKQFKSRLVARGFSQTYGLNYFNTYSPTLSLVILRTLLLAATVLGMHTVVHWDVATAFLNAPLQEKVFMSVPEGIIPPCATHNGKGREMGAQVE